MGQITDAPSSELEQAKRDIWELKKDAERYETQANKQEAKLNRGLLLI